LLRNERRAEAVSQFEAALRIRPDYPEAETNLGVALKDLEDCAAATPHFEAALRIQPDFNDANFNLGACQLMSGSYAAAIPHFEAVIRGRPGDGGAHARLALCLSKIPGRVPDAIREYETALRLTPEDSIAQSNLRALLDRQRTESR